MTQNGSLVKSPKFCYNVPIGIRQYGNNSDAFRNIINCFSEDLQFKDWTCNISYKLN